MSLEREIAQRYSRLAEDTCCLSCGSAIRHSDAQPGEVCVDLGSGRGTDVLRLAEKVGRQGFVYGIDLAEGMIEKARKTAEKMGVRNAAFIKAKLENLPVADGIADLVISNCTLNHAEDKEAVWHEVYRILKKGGRFVVSDIYSTEEVPARYRSDPAAVAECWAGAITRDRYFRILAAAGFRDIAVIEESAPYDKGRITVASITIAGAKPSCGCGGR